MEILIVPDPKKERARKLALEISMWCAKNKIAATLICNGSVKSVKKPVIAVVISGDGFLMHKILEFAKKDIPILGVNAGRVGFLAAVEFNNWRKILKKVKARQYTVDNRLILKISKVSPSGTDYYEAIGDVYIRHTETMVEVRVSVNDYLLHEALRGDGVIVATPTGSTAYNLSAFGPIIESGIAITPICAHSTNKRPVAVNELKTIEIVYLGVKGNQPDSGECRLFVDGKKYPIEPGDKLILEKHEKEAQFIIPEGFSFFEAIQRKLSLTK